MSVEFELKGHGGGIGIIVLGYENPAAADSSDANWLVCQVRVGLGPFHGDVGATFTTHEFDRFRRELRGLLGRERSSAAFETDEQVLALRIEGKPAGTTQISGTVRYSLSPNVALSFTLDSDQSFLGPVVEALDSLIQQFPIRS